MVVVRWCSEDPVKGLVVCDRQGKQEEKWGPIVALPFEHLRTRPATLREMWGCRKKLWKPGFPHTKTCCLYLHTVYKMAHDLVARLQSEVGTKDVLGVAKFLTKNAPKCF